VPVCGGRARCGKPSIWRSGAKRIGRPSIIVVRNIIGYGLPTRQGTAKAHGEPRATRGMKERPRRTWAGSGAALLLAGRSLDYFPPGGHPRRELEAAWQAKFEAYRVEYPGLAAELARRWPASYRTAGERPDRVPRRPKGIASRASSGKVLNAIAEELPDLVAAPQTGAFDAHVDELQPGVPRLTPRKGATSTSVARARMADHKRHRSTAASSPSTRPSLSSRTTCGRSCAWPRCRTEEDLVFTHDSIGVGEDGPTHQPIEHLAALRAIPNLIDLRPADRRKRGLRGGIVAIESEHPPAALVLTRQNLPTLDRTVYASASGLRKGAYVLKDYGESKPQIILMASAQKWA